MSKNIHGTCGNCGGAVTTPMHWGGTTPPIPRCDDCGSEVANPFGEKLPMKPRPNDITDNYDWAKFHSDPEPTP